MVDSAMIKTGVDQLVTLIKEKKKVSTEEAAKALGVSVDAIEGWADFLEDEGVISIETRFSKIYLIERRLTKGEVKKRVKEYHTQREGFIRRIKTSLQQLHSETAGVKKFKQDFFKIKKDIGKDIEKIQKDLEQISKYDEMKALIDQKRADFEKKFEQRIKAIDNKISEEHKKYKGIAMSIEQSEKRVGKEKGAIRSIKEREEEINKRIDLYKKILAELRDKVKAGRQEIELDEKRLAALEKAAQEMKDELKDDKKRLEQLVKQGKAKEQELMGMEKEFIKKIRKDQLFMRKNLEKGKIIQRKFKAFFDKKREIERVLAIIDKDKREMENEMLLLLRKSQAFEPILKTGNVAEYMEELQQEFKKVESRRNIFQRQLQALKNLVTR